MGKPEPWTEDPILQRFKFTNIFRELDRGTLVLRHLIADNPDLTPEDIIFICFWYRLTGKWQTLLFVGPAKTPEELEEGLKKMVSQGRTIYTAAYMTRGKKGIKKWKTTVETSRQVYKHRSLLLQCANRGSLMSLFNDILDLPFWGISKFLAYEIVSDLRHYPQVMGNYVEDAKTWANIGPGCDRGLQRLGRMSDIFELRELFDLAQNYLEPHVLDGVMPFEMREIEHSLCEFDKYQRAATGAGRPKERFYPAEEFIRP